VLLLTGCNTISGMGEDIGAAGSAIKEAANKTKEKL
jgi:predicted small secreted protein